jgi:hypothetical protein
MARRVLKSTLDAQMENPEQRKFAPGFLDRVLASRADLLSDILTIWRWGRHTVLKRGTTLGNYELWCQWARDPLLHLGARDPVDRLAEIKEADPGRRAVQEFFEVWWASHANDTIRSADVHKDVCDHVANALGAKIDRNEKGDKKYSRQMVIGYLNRHAGTRIGHYAFTRTKDQAKRPSYSYQLQKREEEKQEEDIAA